MADTIYMPIEPLEELALRRSGLPKGNREDKDPGKFTDKVFAQMVGVASRTIHRWRADGGRIPWDSADKAATSLGEHPVRVWGEEWLDLDRAVIDGTAPRAVYRKIDKALDQIGVIMAEQVKEQAHDRAGELVA